MIKNIIFDIGNVILTFNIEDVLKRYQLLPEESVFIDDNQNNVNTGNFLGIISCKVEPDEYESIVKVIKELNLT